MQNLLYSYSPQGQTLEIKRSSYKKVLFSVDFEYNFDSENAKNTSSYILT